MLNTLRLKILAVTTVLLLFFAATTGFSTYLVRTVVVEIETLAEYSIPLAAHIASLDVLTYEFELSLRRVLAISQIDAARVTSLRARQKVIVDTLRNDMKFIHRTLDDGIADPRNDVEDPIVMAGIKGSFTHLEDRLGPFIRIGDDVLAAIELGDMSGARTLVSSFGAYEDTFGKELATVRAAIDKLTISSVIETRNTQESTLWFNGVLFAVATVFGLAIFLVLTSRLQRDLGQLLAGAKEVEGGRLDVHLPVSSHDEIGQLGNAFNQMVVQLKEKERVKDTFGKYIDPRIVTRLIDTHGDNATLSERRPATLFFSDIQGFSGMSESLTASAMVNLLNSYFSAVTREIRTTNGIVDKFIGDAVMAFWTAPFSPGDEHAGDACLAALAQQRAIITFRAELPQITGMRRNVPDFAVRMGLATGEVVIGTIGSDTIKSYTVIGDVVNTASRLEGVNKAYGTQIIIDENTFRFAQSVVETRELDLLTVVGKTEPLRVYELLCRGGELPLEQADLRDLFAEGLTAYRAQDWVTADQRFVDCLACKPDDGPAQIFRHRIKLLQAAPPPRDWDGVWRLTEK